MVKIQIYLFCFFVSNLISNAADLPAFIEANQSRGVYLNQDKLEKFTSLLNPRLDVSSFMHKPESYTSRLENLGLLEQRDLIENFYVINFIESNDDEYKKQSLKFLSYTDSLSVENMKIVMSEINRKNQSDIIFVFCYEALKNPFIKSNKTVIYSLHLLKLMRSDLGIKNSIKPLIAIDLLERNGISKRDKIKLIKEVFLDYQRQFEVKKYRRNFSTFLRFIAEKKYSLHLKEFYLFANEVKDPLAFIQVVEPALLLTGDPLSKENQAELEEMKSLDLKFPLKMSLARMTNQYDLDPGNIILLFKQSPYRSKEWELSYSYIMFSLDKSFIPVVIESISKTNEQIELHRLVQLLQTLSGEKFNLNQSKESLLENITSWWNRYKNKSK